MIRVLHPGFYTSIQDQGRFDGVGYGIPISGAMDSISAKRANTLLENNHDAAVLEMTMTGAKLQFEVDTSICITGANMKPNLNGVSVKLNEAIELQKGDILEFNRLQNGFRTYLGVKNGFKTDLNFNSKSWYEGITEQFRLKSNSILKIEESYSIDKNNSNPDIDTDVMSNELRVYPGPEYNRLTKHEQQELFKKDFTVSNYNSRMAYQLEELLPNNLEPIITSPVMPGTVQLTPSGNIIILMRDCQTTGGYPRILQLSEPSICRLAQKYTGKAVRFYHLT